MDPEAEVHDRAALAVAAGHARVVVEALRQAVAMVEEVAEAEAIVVAVAAVVVAVADNRPVSSRCDTALTHDGGTSMMVMTFLKDINKYRLLPLLTMLVILAMGASSPACAATGKQSSFTSPEKAVQRLVAAVKNDHVKKLLAILGPGSETLISSGDTVADTTGRKAFVKLFEEIHSIELLGDKKAVLIIGPKDYPFPIPLVKKEKGWIFNTKAGQEEILNRRIGKNELNAIEVARAYVVAQREYAAKDRDADGALAFAQRFASTPGTKDGLYWGAKEGEQESPFGPLAAQAAQEGYGNSSYADMPDPYHGYIFKILKAQGENTEGGAFDYVVNGKMILGFALIAYPAQYGSSGIMTFIVNQGGVVYQKDLGKDTETIVSAMKLYDPDKSWKKVE